MTDSKVKNIQKKTEVASAATEVLPGEIDAKHAKLTRGRTAVSVTKDSDGKEHVKVTRTDDRKDDREDSWDELLPTFVADKGSGDEGAEEGKRSNKVTNTVPKKKKDRSHIQN